MCVSKDERCVVCVSKVRYSAFIRQSYNVRRTRQQYTVEVLHPHTHVSGYKDIRDVHSCTFVGT